MPKVFIPNHAGHDYTKAEKFGTLKVITEGPLQKFKLNEFAVTCERSMEEANEDDYVLISGLASVCAIACSIIAQKFNRLNILVYRKDRYVKYNFDFANLGDKGIFLDLRDSSKP